MQVIKHISQTCLLMDVKEHLVVSVKEFTDTKGRVFNEIHNMILPKKIVLLGPKISQGCQRYRAASKPI